MKQLGNLYQSPKFVRKNAAYYRNAARTLIQNKLFDAIVVGMLAFLLGVTVMGGINLDITMFLSTTSMSKMTFAVTFLSMAALFVFVSSPLKVGFQRTNLDMIDNYKPSIRELFSFFGICYWKSVWLNILNMALTILPSFLTLTLANYGMQKAFNRVTVTYLSEANETMTRLEPDGPFWITLAIACAICVFSFVWSCFFSYTYRYSYTVLAEYPEVGAIEAMRMSRNMMRGRRWKLFCLDISYIGWLLFSLFTIVGIIFFVPYREAGMISFYRDASNRDSAKDVEFPSLDFKDYKV